MTTFQAKTHGQGDKTVHTYFPSIRWPGLYQRLCQPTGRLWEPTSLRFKPSDAATGWNRACPECQRLETATVQEAIHAES